MPADGSTRTSRRPRLVRVWAGLLWLTLTAGLLLVATAGWRYAEEARAATRAESQLRAQLQAAEALGPPAPAAPPTVAPTVATVPPTPVTPPLGRPVAELTVPAVGLRATVVEGVRDRDLAVGPGHDPRSVLPGLPDNSLFSGHRDRAFRALNGVRPGMAVVTITPYGTFHWVVTGARIVAATDPGILVRTPATTLTLTTCYPFDYIGRASKRYVVTARLADGQLPFLGR